MASRMICCCVVARMCAKWLARSRLNGQVVYSDGWGNDFAWLGLLFEEADLVPRFRVESLRSLLTDDEAAGWHAAKNAVAAEIGSSRHRASGDAQVLRQALLRVKGMKPADKAILT